MKFFGNVACNTRLGSKTKHYNCTLSPTPNFKKTVPPPLLSTISKSKAVPLHAMEAHGGREGIAPTHI
jgi:hypothetical protein